MLASGRRATELPPRPAEQRATLRLLGGPSHVPDAATLTALREGGKAERRSQLLLKAHDELRASCAWARETLVVGGGGEDPEEAGASSSFPSDALREWRDRGRGDCAATAEALGATKRRVREGGVRFAAEMGRLKRAATDRPEDVVAIASEWGRAHAAAVQIRPAAPTCNYHVETDGATARLPTSAVAIL